MNATKKIDWDVYRKNLKCKTDRQLAWSLDDAIQARDAMPDGPNFGVYSDEVAYIGMEIARRAKERQEEAIKVAKRREAQEAAKKHQRESLRMGLEKVFEKHLRVEMRFWGVGLARGWATSACRFVGDREECLAVFDMMIDRYEAVDWVAWTND